MIYTHGFMHTNINAYLHAYIIIVYMMISDDDEDDDDDDDNNSKAYINTYSTCIHHGIHTYIHTHTYMQTSVHPYIRLYIHTCTYMQNAHALFIHIYVVLNLYSLRIVYNAQHLMLSVYSAQYILHIIHNEQNSYTLYIMSNTVKLLIVYNAHRVSSFQGLFRLFRLLLTSRKCDRKQEMISSIVRANLLSESTQSWILDESSLMKKLHV